MKLPDLRQTGTFIGLNPKGWGPLTLQECTCIACERARSWNAAIIECQKIINQENPHVA